MDMHLLFGPRLGLLGLAFPVAVRARRGMVMRMVMRVVSGTDLTLAMPTEVAIRAMRVSVVVSVVMIVPMRRRGVLWRRKSALFAHLLRLSHLVVKCVPTS